MKRRDVLAVASSLGLTGTAALAATRSPVASAAPLPPLPMPASGEIQVAFVIGPGAVTIDFAGPWEVFENVKPFRLFTVAESTEPLTASGGLRIVPNHSFASAPKPQVVVIPAQAAPSDAMLGWIRQVAGDADMVMSVCNGVFVLGKTGLLDGRSATTHHESYADFVDAFDNITLVRGARYVDLGRLASSGGLSSGIDLALHVVERYVGREAARQTANHLEYQGTGWLHPDANAAYAKRRVATAMHPFCQVCEMDVDRDAPTARYRGRTFYFCMPEHQAKFIARPARYL
ncbi:DJ-1/PfpI family protein [Ideonella sp.]|uniref:DJ-1/PfpI family protein n=1 Tax=Ideonella sp. TaxID=1929293 RepID=UPI0035B2A7E2